jgi:hypothetical protein
VNLGIWTFYNFTAHQQGEHMCHPYTPIPFTNSNLEGGKIENRKLTRTKENEIISYPLRFLTPQTGNADNDKYNLQKKYKRHYYLINEKLNNLPYSKLIAAHDRKSKQL